ncbi:SRPBCC family protein [Frankia sp. AgB1.9]|uniref:SRPBCC family protein n=1 Tax=unclassified Frankia TaxID=2632575 RepID=UPI001933EBF9|nr:MULTISPECIES: SRPBCC family protein [unclassified Frankia]MBL7490868.1 SRPBCC family protein [Frankia sp. AgW1.1]MBL7550920.1 SRPBCC family protein [Frankia sp. AgB1.9]MBL7624429.1 SRPBCC family protein [Frankia sp. AgB1.8]
MATTKTVTIEADPNVPLVRMTRDFHATPAQLVRAHTDPALFTQWVGPDGFETTIDYWDARTGGSWRYVGARGGVEHAFHGSFHEVGPARLIQTFTYEGAPDQVALETMWFEDLGDGRTRLHAQSLVDSFESRDAFLNSGMETGVEQGYLKLDALLRALDA